MENKILKKQMILKSKNKRVFFNIYSDGKSEPSIVVQTKKLVDFRTRNILQTNIHLSVETFLILGESYYEFANDLDVKKIINPFSKIPRYKALKITYNQKRKS